MPATAADSVANLLERATVRRLPSLFRRYETQPLQLQAGASGKAGLVDLRFAERGGRTRLVSNFSSGPQRVQRALSLDPYLPEMAFVLLQSVSGGILQGDRLTIDVTAEAGAQAHITTQSATKLYRMEHNYATQRVRLRVERGAYMEFLPDYLIPFRNARLYQEIELEVAEGGTLLMSDALAPGRLASGEAFAYDVLYTSVRAHDTAGRLRFADTLIMQPERSDPRREGILGPYHHIGTLYVLTSAVDAGMLATRLHAGLQGMDGVDAGASRLPLNDGVVVRARGATMPHLQAAMHRAWQNTREAILGLPVPNLQTIKYGWEPEFTSR